MTPYWESEDGRAVVYCADAVEWLATLEPGMVDAVITDPPYLNGCSGVRLLSHGVAKAYKVSAMVGNPWGYSLAWIEAVKRIAPLQWIVFANHKMLGGVCSALEAFLHIGNVFVWRKSNAPRMLRPAPRMDCEFIVWARTHDAKCDRMGEFDSSLLDVPMPQAGCFAVERLLAEGGKSAAHPCQKPIRVVEPFVRRLNAPVILDPFMGTGTTGVGALRNGRRFLGCDISEEYCAIAVRRLERVLAQPALPFDEPVKRAKPAPEPTLLEVP